MKKFTLSFFMAVVLLFAYNVMAQTAQRDALYFEDFESFNVGDHIAQVNPDWWRTWGDSPGTAEDAVISDEQSLSGTKSLKFTGDNDNLVKLGNKIAGEYELSWNVFIPGGFAGYFNLQHFEAPGNEWAVEVYFDDNGTGLIHAGGSNAATFTYPQDTWVPIFINVNLDDDEATLFINDVFVHTWQFSLQAQGQAGAKQLGAINFYSGATTGMTPTYYIDDLEVYFVYDDVIFDDDFDSYNAGDYVSVTIPEFFVTWSNIPGSTEDAKFSSEQSLSAPNSIKVDGQTDLLFKLGNKTSGAYIVEWDFFVPTGLAGYYNLQHFEAPGNEWAVEVYFDNNGTGLMHAGGENAATFNYPQNEWFRISHLIDLDNDWIELYFEDDLIYEWQFSLQAQGEPGTKQLGSVDFYAGASTGMTPTYYVDNLFYMVLIPGSMDPTIQIDASAIILTLEEGTSTTKNLPVTNIGEAPLNVDIVSSFDQPASAVSNPIPSGTVGKVTGEFVLDPNPYRGDPAPNNRDVTLHYDGENNTGIGITDGGQWRLSARFPASMVGQYNGMYLTSIMIYINDPGDDHKIQVYDMGSINVPGPGELLTEQPFLPSPGWNAIPLVNPVFISGRDIWIGYWVDQPPSIYPAGADAGPQIADGAWLSTGPGWRLLTLDNNWNIRGILTGDAGEVWLSANPNQMTIEPGETVDVTVGVDATGLTPLNVYKGKLIVRSNDFINEQININVWITVLVGLNEHGEQTYVAIYPNPATTVLNLDVNTDIQQIVITNSLGQIVYHRQGELPTSQIDISRFDAGMYFVRVETAHGTAVQKLIKQ